MEKIIADLKDQARATWEGEPGERRAVELETFLRHMLATYAAKLGFSQLDLLTAFEKKRDYSAINYYQQANFPDLEKVLILNTFDEFKRRFPSGRFICPLCGGVSTDAYECNSGVQVGHGTENRTCDWKAYGLFGTAGKGLRVVILDTFLDNPRVHEIFMPEEMAGKEEGNDSIQEAA